MGSHSVVFRQKQPDLFQSQAGGEDVISRFSHSVRVRREKSIVGPSTKGNCIFEDPPELERNLSLSMSDTI